MLAQQLDREKPLWEIWLVEGLEGDRFAVLSKTHHALVDGISGVDIVSVLFDLGPRPEAARARAPLAARPDAVAHAAAERGAPRACRVPSEIARSVRAVSARRGRSRRSARLAVGVGAMASAG